MTSPPMDLNSKDTQSLLDRKKEKGLRFSAILAQSLNGVIGRNGSLPWNEKEDLSFFMHHTMGAWLLMGRRTWESIARSPAHLPGRHLIVLSRNAGLKLPRSVSRASSLEEAIDICPDKAKVFVAGGAGPYKESLVLLDELWLTLIKVLCVGDTFFHALQEIQVTDWEIIEQKALSPKAELFGLKKKGSITN